MSTAILLTPIPATPLITADEFLAQYGDESGIELIKGHVVRDPGTGGRKGQVCGNAAFLIGEFARERSLGRVMSNDTFIDTTHDPDSIRGADVCFLSYARLPKDQETPRGPIPAPDLVIEVRSPTDRLNALTSKAMEYLEVGVTVVVVLDPESKTAAVYRGEEFPVRLASTDELALPDVLPEFRVPVRAFFE